MADEPKKTDDTKDVSEKEEKSTQSVSKNENNNVSKNVQSIVDDVSKLSVLELSELVNALQETLGVSAMPMAAAPAAGGAAAEAGAAGADDAGGGATTLIMTASATPVVPVIQALRAINQNWGLKEAKDMTENLPAEIIKDGKPEEVKEAAEKLKSAGATVELK